MIPLLARIYSATTAALGLLYVVYNALWLGRPNPPFQAPLWLVLGQLTWGLVSFGMMFLFEKDRRSPVLPALYVVYTTATFGYVWYLGISRGTVLDEMVPGWWKVIAGTIGLVLLIEGVRQARRPRGPSDVDSL
ncbi:MAG: hypothetical protein R3338_04150 [Thermoanaerobaculia bacterium]|nr:hypothetical protein [Thermoanaerobaculia bacterium]